MVEEEAIKNLMQGIEKCTKIELRRDWFMYALRTWETSPSALIKEYKEKLTDDEVFVMTAAEQLRQQGIVLGKAEGEKLGEHKKALATARNMLLRGLNAQLVVECTNLSIEEVTALADEVNGSKH
ncbi:hypothetical protein [Cysteiniphilum halobium]|uniref:hypothetical protein n=1 Tax=Cysteiniphilum halobium TaxID=2219059 RepID=UPI003F87D2BC